jgi:hypothetical protein
MNIKTIKASKKDGKLVIDDGQQLLFDLFLKQMVKDGDTLFITYEVETDDHSYAQVSKIHASIRELAISTGEDFEEMKIIVKREMGLFEPGTDKLKSFGKYSKTELSEAIRLVIKWGDIAGLNLS